MASTAFENLCAAGVIKVGPTIVEAVGLAGEGRKVMVAWPSVRLGTEGPDRRRRLRAVRCGRRGELTVPQQRHSIGQCSARSWVTVSNATPRSVSPRSTALGPAVRSGSARMSVHRTADRRPQGQGASNGDRCCCPRKGRRLFLREASRPTCNPALAPPLPPRPNAAPRAGPRRDAAFIEMGEEAKILKTRPRPAAGSARASVPIEHFQAHQAPKKGGFPGAGRTQQTKMLAPGSNMMIAKEFIDPKGSRAPVRVAPRACKAPHATKGTMATKGRRISRHSPAAAIRGVGLASRA